MATKKIGILYICTGNYILFWKEFYLSMEKNFIVDSEKHYFVFTDSPTIEFEEENPRIHKIYQNNLGWPNNTLMRFHMFLKHENEMLGMDYLFFFNANLLVLQNITSDEFLPKDGKNLVATLHPGFFDKKRVEFTYDENPNSKAYIPKEEGKHYFAGGLNGGITSHFIEAMKTMREWVNTDTNNGIIALWHDESQWNKYLIDRTDVKILEPSYLYPEGWELRIGPIILVRDKNKYGGHNKLRKEKSTFRDTVKKTLSNLSLFSPAKTIIATHGVNIQNAPLLIISIAYNNSNILQIQYKHLKENLEENFVYIIADNSNDQGVSRVIEDFCHSEKIPYVKLPNNPHKNPSKSHGTALQWAYKNIVQLYNPHYFGFLDHDIFPERKTSIISKLRNGIFGLVQERGEKWYLWPGFCFYDFNVVKKIKLNFMPCKGLDTGGSNYYTLYKGIDKDTLIKVPQIYINTNTGKEVPSINNENTLTTVEHLGDWLHIMRASNWNNQKNDKSSLVIKLNNYDKKIIDVIIPVYNGAKFILDALESVVNQTLPPSKIIVVDDGSTDNTNPFVAEYAKNSQVKIQIVKKENGGLSSARNAGIRESAAEFIAFLDADDVWVNNKLEEQLKIYEHAQFKNLGLVYCNYDVVNSAGILQYKNYKVPLENRMRGMVFKRLLKINKITGSGSGVLIKREVFDAVGLFDEKLRLWEDWDMWLRIAEKYEVDFVDKILVHIRKHDDNMTGNPARVFEGELAFYSKWMPLIEGRFSIPIFWADRITLRIISRLPKTDFIKTLKSGLPKQIYKKLFRNTLGSFYLHIPLFIIRQSFNALSSLNNIRRVLGFVKHKGK